MALSTQDQDALAQQIAQTPGALQAFIANRQKAKDFKSPGKAGTGIFGYNDTALLKQFGIDLPHDYEVGFDPATGQPVVRHLNWFERNQDWILPVATIGSAGALSGLAGGTAAGTSAASAAPSGGVEIGETGAVTGLGGSGFAGSAGGIGATAGPSAAGTAGGLSGGVLPTAARVTSGSSSLWPTLLGVGIPAATSLIGAGIQSKALSDSAKTQAEASEKALELQRELFNRSLEEDRRKEDLARADFAPYGSIGQGALSALAKGSGIDLGAFPAAKSPALQPIQANGTLGALGGAQSAPQTAPQAQGVAMLSPTGQRGMVPQNRVQEALAAGGRMA